MQILCIGPVSVYLSPPPANGSGHSSSIYIPHTTPSLSPAVIPLKHGDFQQGERCGGGGGGREGEGCSFSGGFS